MAVGLLVAGHVVRHAVELGVDFQHVQVPWYWLVMEPMQLDEPGQWVVPVVDQLVLQREDGLMLQLVLVVRLCGNVCGSLLPENWPEVVVFQSEGREVVEVGELASLQGCLYEAVYLFQQVGHVIHLVTLSVGELVQDGLDSVAEGPVEDLWVFFEMGNQQVRVVEPCQPRVVHDE